VKFKADDISLLLPAFRERIETVTARMRARGFSPLLKDGLRTPKEALKNAANKTGIVQSMHLYGCAADIICSVHGWDCDGAKGKKDGTHHGFYEALGEEYKRSGIVWGGDWNGNGVADAHDNDRVHGQGVPATAAAQNAMRALGTTAKSAAARNALVIKHFAGR
jgi:hypothetical protein